MSPLVVASSDLSRAREMMMVRRSEVVVVAVYEEERGDERVGMYVIMGNIVGFVVWMWVVHHGGIV